MHPKIPGWIKAIAACTLTLPFLLSSGLHRSAVQDCQANLISEYICSNVQDPITIVDTLARENRTLMFCSSHISSGSQLFAGDRLVDLKSQGYDVLAIEEEDYHQPTLDAFVGGRITASTLEHEIEDLRFATGIEMLETARRLGIKVVAIDGDYDNVERDPYMMGNLKALIFDQDPSAKVIIYIGSLHCIEHGDVKGVTYLGELLEEYTGGHNASIYLAFGPSIFLDLFSITIKSDIGFMTEGLGDSVFVPNVKTDPAEIYYPDKIYFRDFDAVIVP